MNQNVWSYGKSIAKGILTAFAVILLYTLLDVIYFNNQLLLADCIDTIKMYVVACSIVLFLVLTYFFYWQLKNRRAIDFVLLVSPYLLMLIVVSIDSVNIPRMLDFLYLFTGSAILFLKFKEGSWMYQRNYIFPCFLMFTVLTYPYVYENISFNYYKGKEEHIAIQEKLDFEMYDRAGKTYRLSDFKSKTVCVDMWSSTCGGCIRSMPEFEKLNVKFKNNPEYKIISLFCPMKEHETYEWFKKYIDEEFNYNIDYYYIPKDDFKKLGIYRFPEFLLLDKNNFIVYRGLVTYNTSTYDNIYEKLEKINSNE